MYAWITEHDIGKVLFGMMYVLAPMMEYLVHEFEMSSCAWNEEEMAKVISIKMVAWRRCLATASGHIWRRPRDELIMRVCILSTNCTIQIALRPFQIVGKQ